MWTPPLTPAQGHGTHSASSSVSGIPGLGAGLRRESESEREDAAAAAAAAARKRDLQAVPEVEEGREPKKRRIAPTPVTVGGMDASESAIVSTEENTPTAQTPSQQ